MQLQLTNLPTWILLVFLSATPAGAATPASVEKLNSALQSTHQAEDSRQAAQDCENIGMMLEEQKQILSGEIGRMRREMALLRQELSTPGMKEILAGIGYVFGLAGIALYLQSRKVTQRR